MASTSRYRAELLSRLQLPFETASPDIDEAPLAGEEPAETALRLALAKARRIAIDRPDALIIGADQVADLSGRHIGKPGTRERAREQLSQMRGQTLVFHSALALINTESGREQVLNVPTQVRFRNYSDGELENYLDRENALDCAGSAKAEGLGLALIDAIQSDDPSALIGLPLIALTGMLANEGLHVLA